MVPPAAWYNPYFGLGVQLPGDPNIGSKSVSSVAAVKADRRTGIPKVFALSNSYPNPFNPSTRFQVDVPRETFLSIAIYNMLGQKVATIYEGPQTPGVRTFEWNGRNSSSGDVPSGIYFIRMSAPGFEAVRKVMLIK
jgi:hypothetical protein